MRKERWQAGPIQGGENAVVQVCLRFWATVDTTQRTVESVRQAAETARRSVVQAEEFMRQTFDEDRRQQIIQSMQDTVETVKLTVSHSVSQQVDDTLSQNGSSLPPELQALSIRPMHPFQPRSPATGGSGWNDGKFDLKDIVFQPHSPATSGSGEG